MRYISSYFVEKINSFGFKMDMLDGKYWGNYKKMNEEIYDEDFFADFEDYIIDHNKVGILCVPQ